MWSCVGAEERGLLLNSLVADIDFGVQAFLAVFLPVCIRPSGSMAETIAE